MSEEVKVDDDQASVDSKDDGASKGAGSSALDAKLNQLNALADKLTKANEPKPEPKPEAKPKPKPKDDDGSDLLKRELEEKEARIKAQEDYIVGLAEDALGGLPDDAREMLVGLRGDFKDPIQWAAKVQQIAGKLAGAPTKKGGENTPASGSTRQGISTDPERGVIKKHEFTPSTVERVQSMGGHMRGRNFDAIKGYVSSTLMEDGSPKFTMTTQDFVEAIYKAGRK